MPAGTPTQTDNPTTGTALESPAPTRKPVTIDYSHDLAIYTRQKAEPGGAIPDTVREVVTYDLANGVEVAAFAYTAAPGGDHGRVRLAGRTVVVASESRVAIHALDGNLLRVYVTTDDNSTRVQSIAVSPDARLLAVALAPVDLTRFRDASLVVMNVSTGGTVFTLSQQDPRFDDYRGRSWRLSWQEDGQAVAVFGSTPTERPGPLAIVTLSGSVQLVPAAEEGRTLVSQTGLHLAVAADGFLCHPAPPRAVGSRFSTWLREESFTP